MKKYLALFLSFIILSSAALIGVQVYAAADAVSGVIANTPSSIAIITRKLIIRFLDFVFIEFSSFFLFLFPLPRKARG